MTDACALYLSYGLANHQSPHVLLQRVPAAKAGPQAQQLDQYDNDERYSGILYRDNGAITAPGRAVLDFAERARPREYAQDFNGLEEGEVPAPTTLASGLRRVVEHGSTPSTVPRQRAPSLAMSDGLSPAPRLKSLDTTRSRIQGDTIKSLGVHSNDLWRSSLRMLVLARRVLHRAQSTQDVQDQQQRSKKLNLGSKDTGPASPLAGVRRARAASVAPLAPVNVNAPILRLQKHRLVNELKPAMVQKPKPVVEALKILPTKVPEPSKPYQTNLPCGFTLDIWATIIAYATDASEKLSRRQQLQVTRRAMDRETLRQERDLLGKPENNQIWHVLEGMGCLAYERL
jgi:hypothetical protein